MCARFLSCLLLLYIGRVHGEISGCTVLGEVHPVSAQNINTIVCISNKGIAICLKSSSLFRWSITENNGQNN